MLNWEKSKRGWQLNKIAKHLNHYITGAVYGEFPVLEGYSTDRSILKIRPKVVAVPRTAGDIRKLVRFSNQLALKNYKLPVTVRGSGLDKTGAAIGPGMIISMEEMDHVKEIDPRQRLVRLQTGVTLGALNTALSLHNLILPVDGDPNQTIGGLIANDYGNLRSRITQAEIVLSNGDIIQTERLRPRRLNRKKGATGFEGELYRQLDNFLLDHAEDLANITPGTRTGYATIPQIKVKNGSFDILSAFFGSQGTLGIITEIILNCDLSDEPNQFFIAAFPSANTALNFIEYAAKIKPSAIDIYDTNLFTIATESGKKFRPLKSLPENGIVVNVSLNDSNKRHRSRKINRLTALLNKSTRYAVSNNDNYANFIELKTILSVYFNQHPHTIHAPITDDTFIPFKQLKKYFTAIAELEDKHKIALPIFGSVLANRYSVRPEIDLGSVTGRQFALAFMREYNELIMDCDGSFAGGSAEGRLKAIFVNTHLDPELKKLYQEFKTIFDPNSILNPDVKQGANIRAVVRALRTSYNTGIIKE